MRSPNLTAQTIRNIGKLINPIPYRAGNSAKIPSDLMTTRSKKKKSAVVQKSDVRSVLLTFTGFHDPFSRGLVGEEEQAGPILTLISALHFDRIILFSTPATRDISARTREEIIRRYPDVLVRITDLNLTDPTDYRAILGSLRTELMSLQDEFTEANFHISPASGTPQMHSAWVLLAASGEIPAKLLNVRPPRFVTKDLPLVSVIDLASKEFPTVRARVADRIPATSLAEFDVNAAIRELNLVGDHPEILKAIEMASALADSDLPIIIRGETGTGKELFARLIHIASGRPRDRFIPVNCAAIPENLLESVLFGHTKGAFTGAMKDQKGKLEIADGGTLFLDELGELPMAAQAKLLRVLQDGIVEPVGAERGRVVDVRVVAATNRDVGKAIHTGLFREDLYYRLCAGEVVLPPLRKRKSDIPKIALSLPNKQKTITFLIHKRWVSRLVMSRKVGNNTFSAFLPQNQTLR